METIALGQFLAQIPILEKLKLLLGLPCHLSLQNLELTMAFKSTTLLFYTNYGTLIGQVSGY